MESLIIFSLKKMYFQSLSFIQKRIQTKHNDTNFLLRDISDLQGTRRPQNNNQNNFNKNMVEFMNKFVLFLVVQYKR